MLLYDRQKKILELMKQNPSVTVEFLCEKVFASPATIRRDLNQMSHLGLLKKVHGGAVSNDGANQDPPLLVRQQSEMTSKKHIAELAIKLCKEGQTLFLDSSSTITSLAREIAKSGSYSILSNGIETVSILNESPNIKLYSCGGKVKNHSSVVGSIAEDTVKRFHADILFFSCSGISENSGVTEGSEDTAAVKKCMINNSRVKVLLCDSSKFGLEFFCRTCEMNDIDVLITDKKPSESFLNKLPKRIKVLY